MVRIECKGVVREMRCSEGIIRHFLSFFLFLSLLSRNQIRRDKRAVVLRRLRLRVRDEWGGKDDDEALYSKGGSNQQTSIDVRIGVCHIWTHRHPSSRSESVCFVSMH